MSTKHRILKRLSAAPDVLTVEWADNTAARFSSQWLRDNVREDRDPHSGQRLIDIADLPERPRIRTATAEGSTVRIEWEGEERRAAFDAEWLARHAGESAHRPPDAPHLWLEGAALDTAHDFGWASFTEIKSDEAARLRWLRRLLAQGMALLRDVSCVDTGIVEAMQLVGQIAETNYGQVFDVRSVPQPENLAYSDLGLGLHTDNPYREPVPGYQALHALLASPDGGDSLFADGYAIAEHLRAQAPDAFGLLTRTAVPFHYRSANAELYAERPLIQLSCRGEVAAVHYNSRSMAPLPDATPEGAAYYSAYRRFAALLREPRFQMCCKLRDGDLVLFDNQRILHGRTAFSSARHARHLRGCYLTRDSVHGAAALLRRRLLTEGAA